MSVRQHWFKLQEFLLRFAASGLFPARWIYNVPAKPALEQPTGRPDTIEIVSHCWNYSHLLRYQLQSLIDNAPSDLQITHTVFYSDQDKETVALLRSVESGSSETIEWNFIALPTEDLLRRAIGRNMAAKNTRADWIWFTDCDLIFGAETFSSLKEALTGQDSILVFPGTVSRTSLLSQQDEMLHGDKFSAEDCLNRDCVKQHTFEKATGPVQIVRGDIAREYGYCEQLDCYQQPKERWVKTYEDRTFRWLLGTHGQAVEVDDVGIIRHVEKGRYNKSSSLPKLRKANRRLKDKLLAR